MTSVAVKIMVMNNDRKIEDILNGFDGAQRAAAPDFFYTRLKARMEKGVPAASARSWVLRPVYAMSALFIVLLLNTFVLLRNNRTAGATGTETAATDAEMMQSIASEYSINSNITYELNQ